MHSRKTTIPKVVLFFCFFLFSSCTYLFPDTSALKDIKATYEQYVNLREDSLASSASTAKIQLETRKKLLDRITEVKKSAKKDDPAYIQAAVIEDLVLRPEGISTSEEYFLHLTKDGILDKQEPWVQNAVYLLLGQHFCSSGNLSLGEKFFQRIIDGESPTDDERVYAYASLINGILNAGSISEDVCIEKLRLVAASLEIVLNSSPIDPNYLYLAAEVYSQIGVTDKACDDAKAAKAVGLKGARERATQLIIDTDC
jgi:hypothetical protein